MINENKAKLEGKLKNELQLFEGRWEGGYFEGDPLDPMSRSTYGILGFMSILHVIYLTCIRPYVNENSIVLEIGPGRGAWTKTFSKAKEIWCLDALSAEHNKFWEYVGHSEKIKYIHVKDFNCSELPDNKFNYLFSFGTLCHVSFEGISEYMKNIYPKLISGAQCFIMIADYEKFNNAVNNIDSLSVLRLFEFINVKRWYEKCALKYFSHFVKRYCIAKQENLQPLSLHEDDIPRSERWYNAGIGRTCSMLQKFGYKIDSPDMCVLSRDPVIHFSKP